MNKPMTIGQVAEAAGVNVETVRYYQRRGLMGEPAKPPGGQRRYSAEALRRIAFIRSAQQLGFSLEEVKELIAISESGSNCRRAQRMAEDKHAALGVRMEQIAGMRRRLSRLIARCKASPPRTPCPLLVAMAEADGLLPSAGSAVSGRRPKGPRGGSSTR